MDRPFRALVPALVFATLAACAHAGMPRCATGSQPVVQERLYFGTQRPAGVVSGAEWSAFVDEVVAAAFPDGFTAWDAAGGWRGADGRPLREASHVVEIVHPAGTATDTAIAKVIADYKTRFDQEAVMQARVPACVAFR